MIKFIELTLISGTPIAINVDGINSFARSKEYTNIYMMGDDEPCSVKETYSEILSKIKEITK